MPQITEDYRYGIRKSSGVINLAAASTPVTVYTPPGLVAGASTSASRTFVIRKIHLFNEGTLTGQVEFGTGLAGAFVQSLPGINILPGQMVTLTEDEICNVEFSVALTASQTVAGATDIDLVVEVQEFEGGSAPV